MRFNTIGLSLVIACCAFMSFRGNASQETVRITHAGLTIEVPRDLLIAESRFEWVQDSKGLDADALSFRIRVPLHYLLGESRFSPETVTAAIFLADENNLKASNAERMKILKEIVFGARGYDDAEVEPLGVNDWFKVVPTPGLDTWDVIDRMPDYYQANAITSDALIARCGSPALVKKVTCNTMFAGDRVLIHLSFTGEMLETLPEIQYALKCMLSDWIVDNKDRNDDG